MQLLTALSNDAVLSSAHTIKRGLRIDLMYVGGYVHPSYYLVPVFAILVMLVVLGLRAAFFGFTAMRTSAFLATFVSVAIVSAYAFHYSLIGALAGFVLGVVSLVPEFAKYGPILVGFGFGATFVNVVATAVAWLFNLYILNYAVLAAAVVVGLAGGCCGGQNNTTFLIMATGGMGSFAVSSAIVATIEVISIATKVTFRPIDARVYVAILLAVGAVLTVCGFTHQKAKLAKAVPTIPIPHASDQLVI